MPESNELSRYGMMPKNVTAQHMLLHFPFDPGSANGLIFEGVALVFDNSLLRNLRYGMFGEILAVEIGDRAGDFADQVFDGNSQRNNPEVTLPGAVQSWLKCLDNESTTVGVFVAAPTSAIEIGQSNLVDQMLDEMPPSCSKVFDPGPSVTTVILAAMALYITDGHSGEDNLFNECPQLVESEILGSAFAFQVNLTKQFVCDGDRKGEIQVARLIQLQVKLSLFDFSGIFACIEPIISHLLEITALEIHACNWIDTGQRLAINFIHVATHLGPSLRLVILNVFDRGRDIWVSVECELSLQELSSFGLLILTLVAHERFEKSGKRAFTYLYVSIRTTECLVYIAQSLNLCAVAKFYSYFQLKYLYISFLFDDYLRVPEDGMTKQGLIESYSWFRDIPVTLLFTNVPVTECLIGVATKLYVTLTIANTVFYALVGVIAGLNITSTITELTSIAVSYGLSNDVINIDLNNKVPNHFEVDFKSELRKDFISKPIVLSSTWTACEEASSVASIAKCFEDAFEPCNLMKLVGYQLFDITFVSMISSCSVLAPLKQGQQIHSNNISTGAISVVAIVSPLFRMYSTSGCFNVAVRNFEETGEADIVVHYYDFCLWDF
ncbi:hypothetical protein RND71_013999 [Anisodus tanguticus]|uniref:Uncharacterized protein n=1 Tax=Anisodus tanguticus TaxID=243964 RepID=A0AAE1S8B3_9SOLA|nr:hypothetical protein RND71_013999 [Anisodus tanguticus]